MTFTKPFYIFVFAEAEHYPGLRNIPEKGLRIISDTQSVDRWGHFSSHNGYVLLTFQVFLSRASAIAPQANEAVQSIGVNYGFSVRRTVFSILENKFKIWRTFGGQLEIQIHPRVPPLYCFWIYLCNFLIQIFYPRVGHRGGQINNL